MEIYDSDGTLIKKVDEPPIYCALDWEVFKQLDENQKKELEEHADQVIITAVAPWRTAGVSVQYLSSYVKETTPLGYYECYVEEKNGEKWYHVISPYTITFYGGRMETRDGGMKTLNPRPLVYLEEYHEMVFARDDDPEDIQIPFPDLNNEGSNGRYRGRLPE